MKENTNRGFRMTKESIIPARIIDCFQIENAQELLVSKEPCVSFGNEPCACFTDKNAWALLDFGKELCGGLRLITRSAPVGTEIPSVKPAELSTKKMPLTTMLRVILLFFSPLGLI